MQLDIEKSNERFQRLFQSFNLLWVIISAISITFATYSVFINKPAYLHDWRGIAIIALALFIMVIYAFGLYSRFVFRVQDQWPPAFHRAFACWFSVYVGVLLLSTIDAAFSWCFFIVMGISFALFNAPRLLLFVSIIFITLSAFQGLLSWPLAGDNLGSLFGLGLAFFSMTVSCMFMQHLIGGWHERNDLLAKISCANRELEEAHRNWPSQLPRNRSLRSCVSVQGWRVRCTIRSVMHWPLYPLNWRSRSGSVSAILNAATANWRRPGRLCGTA